MRIGAVSLARASRTAACPTRRRPSAAGYQPAVPGSPLNGPWISDVIQPP